jgi:hypothetical protein
MLDFGAKVVFLKRISLRETVKAKNIFILNILHISIDAF